MPWYNPNPMTWFSREANMTSGQCLMLHLGERLKGRELIRFYDWAFGGSLIADKTASQLRSLWNYRHPENKLQFTDPVTNYVAEAMVFVYKQEKAKERRMNFYRCEVCSTEKEAIGEAYQRTPFETVRLDGEDTEVCEQCEIKIAEFIRRMKKENLERFKCKCCCKCHNLESRN